MIDKMILEVMNPSYDTLNVIDAMMNAKWAVLVHIDQAFAEKKWKLDPGTFREAIQALKKAQAKGQTGVFPKMLVGAPDGDWVDFNILFDKKTSLTSNQIKFDILYPKKKKKSGFVPSVRLLSVSSFAEAFVNKFISLYNGNVEEIDSKALEFDYSTQLKSGEEWMRLNRLFDGIELTVDEESGSILMMIRMTGREKGRKDGYKCLGHDGSIEESDDGDIYSAILYELVRLSTNGSSSKNYNKIDKMTDRYRGGDTNQDKLFYYPDQKANFMKFVTFMFSDAVFNRYFADMFNKKKVAYYEMDFNKEQQRVDMRFYNKNYRSYNPEPPLTVDALRSRVTRSVTKGAEKYGSKFKSKSECWDFIVQKLIVKLILLLDTIKKLDEDENTNNLIFLIKQL